MSAVPSPSAPATTTTQYDQIGQSYESMKQIPGAALERNNLRDAIVPYLTLPDGQGASVLDLACGTGFYSRLLLEWAAPRRVVGVDISAAMVAAAQRSAAELAPEAVRQGRLTFAVGDATQPLALALPATGFSDGAGNSSSSSSSSSFDVVLGAWLLNYAPSTAAMARMFVNVAAALRPGGHFVGITPHPADDLDGFAAFHGTAAAQAAMRRFGVSIAYDVAAPLASGEGFRTRITAHVPPREIAFDNFHLRRRVYEDAARQGGMAGALKWLDVRLPRTDEESRAEYGVGSDYWDGCVERPHFGILVVQK